MRHRYYFIYIFDEAIRGIDSVKYFLYNSTTKKFYTFSLISYLVIKTPGISGIQRVNPRKRSVLVKATSIGTFKRTRTITEPASKPPIPPGRKETVLAIVAIMIAAKAIIILAE